MKQLKRTFNREFLDTWTLCSIECGACFYHAPIVPHNFIDLPPTEWSPPLEKCPSYDYFGFRAYTAVGRGDIAADINDNPDYPVTDDLLKVLYTCMGCGMCSEICYKLRPLTANLAIREVLVDRGVNPPEPLSQIDESIKNLGNCLGVTEPSRAIEGIQTEGADLYFAGCMARFKKPEVVDATVAILKKAGLDVACLGADEKCCGLIPSNDGNTAILEKRAAENFAAFEKAGAKRIITSCAHCYKTLKVDYEMVAGELPFEVVHVAELFSRLIDEGRINFERPIDKRITYHDPCFLGRYCYVLDEPRKVLRSIPGIELVEMEPNGKWSHCCGSGTKISAACYPEFSKAVTEKRLAQGKEAADTIVTACTTCYQHMDKASKAANAGVEIIDLPLLVAEAMGV
jgi:heterodisulfide reductase subunit D